VPIGATDSKELLSLPYFSKRDRFDQAKANEREVQRAHGFFHYHFRSEFRLSTFARWTIYIIGAHIFAGILGLSARWIFKGLPPW
jgi:hypothetical protein